MVAEVSLYEIAIRWMPLDLTDDKSTLVQVMAWCHQATSHYLNQCWPRSVLPYRVTKPQWINISVTAEVSLWKNMWEYILGNVNEVAIMYYPLYIRAPGLCNMGNPSETHLKLKSCEFSSVYNIRFSRPIVLKFCTECSNITALPCAKFQNNWVTENWVSVELWTNILYCVASLIPTKGISNWFDIKDATVLQYSISQALSGLASGVPHNSMGPLRNIARGPNGPWILGSLL